MFLVIVMPPIDINIPNPEELLQCFETMFTPRSLDNREIVRDLIAGSVAFTVFPIWLSDKTNGEATFPVYKTSNPSNFDQSFLLIFCTGRIVTHAKSVHTYTSPHKYRQILSFSSI